MAAPVTEPEALSAGLDFRSEPMLLASAEVVDLIASSWLELDSLRPWDTALAAERVAEAFNDSGNNHYDNGDFDDALTAYGRALQILPAYAWAYCNRAAVFLATDDIAAAIEDYTTAIGYDAADSALYNGRAFALLQRQPRDLDAALADATTALSLEEANGAAHCTKGAILNAIAESELQGTDAWHQHTRDATLHLRRAIELEPEAQEPRDLLQSVLKMTGSAELVEPARGRKLSSVAKVEVTELVPEGWLHKKGGLKDGERNWMKGGRRNWKLRWFAFDGAVIRWSEKKGAKVLGELVLDESCTVEVDLDNPRKFCVRSPQRDLWLRADDDSAPQWMASIRSVLPDDAAR